MESNSAEAAREQLASLADSRELALGRIFLPRRYVIAWAVLMNMCLLSVVLPIVLSSGWTLLVQAVFLAAAFVLLWSQKRLDVVHRPMLRLHRAWLLTAVASVLLGAALAVGIYARLNDEAWLGAAALLINFGAYLVAYGGQGYLVRRQLARLT